MNTAAPLHAENPERKFYDRISRVYDLISDSSEHAAREAGLTLLGATAGERVLEVGFGTGHCLVALARSVGPQGRVAGVDISAGMAQVARERLTKEGLADRVDLQVADVPPLPFGDAAFDATFMSFTLELFDASKIPAVLHDVRRVLKPNGRLGVVGMELEKDPNWGTKTYQWFHRHFPHIVDCRPIDVPGSVQAAGFTIASQERMEISTLPVAAVVGRR
jgi:demethylmenaquinone methyltransferase/2-methoxy-6-polyprenyl-1,4-benzoquinol methylase